MNVYHNSHYNSDTESDRKYGGTKYDSTKHHVYNYELGDFGQTTGSSLKNSLSFKYYQVCFGILSLKN